MTTVIAKWQWQSTHLGSGNNGPAKEAAGISCAFLVMYTRDEFTNRGSAGVWSPDVESIMQEWNESGRDGEGSGSIFFTTCLVANQMSSFASQIFVVDESGKIRIVVGSSTRISILDMITSIDSHTFPLQVPQSAQASPFSPRFKEVQR